MMKILVQHGANLNARLREGIKDKSPLICAVEKSQVKAAKYLLEHGADADGGRGSGNHFPLLMAAKMDNIELVKTLVEHGANVNLCFDNTPLHEMAVAGNVEGVKLLLKHSAFVDAENIEGKSALVDVSEELDRDAVQPNKRGRDPYVTIINLLLYHGADVNMISKDGSSVLSNAIEEGSLSLVKFWVESAGADAWRFPLSSYVSMSKALWIGGSKRILSYLTEKGARFDIADRYGQRGFGLEGTGEAAEIGDLVMRHMKYNIDGSDASDDDDDDANWEDDESSVSGEFHINSDSDDDDDELADPQELNDLLRDVEKMEKAMHLLCGLGDDDDDDDDIDPVKALKFFEEIDKTSIMKDSLKDMVRKERRWIKDNPDVAESMYLKGKVVQYNYFV